VLKCIEVWAAVSINRGDLSIKDDIADGKASYLPNRIGEAKAKVIATLGKETDGARALVNLASPAIELDLMKPAEAFRRPVSPGWNAGLEKANAEQAAALKLSSLDSTKLPAGLQAKLLLRRS
jgi:hypothetical protein